MAKYPAENSGDSQSSPSAGNPYSSRKLSRAAAKLPPVLITRETLIAHLRRLFHEYLAPRWRSIVGIFFWILIVAGTTALYPLIINWAFNAADKKYMAAIYIIPIATLGIVFSKSLALFIQARMSNRLRADIEYDLRLQLYKHLIDADIAQLTRQSAAAHTARFSVDVSFMLQAINRIIQNAGRDIITMMALLGAMFWLDSQLALITVVIAPFAIWPTVIIGRRLRGITKDTQERMGDMTSILHESFAGARMAKTYTLEEWLKSRATGIFGKMRSLSIRAANQGAMISPIMEGLAGIAVAGVIAFAGIRIAADQSTLGQFTGFVSALLLAAQPLNRLGSLNASLQMGFAATTRIFALLDEEPDIHDKPDAKPLEAARGEIAFKDVSFSYDETTAAVTDINLTIAPGTTVALVGRSGAGKSTLFSLVPRLYDANTGTISIDGTDIRDVTITSLRQHIGFVSQDVVMYDDTVRTNIALGNLQATEEEIHQAAKAAAAHDFISAMPDGYDTLVGDRGMRLSGGERQRIALARAILKDAPILLLDEATSALDTESEALIQDALARLAKSRTTLVIAHRLSTVRDADLIAVMDKGQIAEIGSHDELLQKDGPYALLYNLQFRKNGADLTSTDQVPGEAEDEISDPDMTDEPKTQSPT